MLLKSYKNILPVSVGFIGGIVFAFGQPEIPLSSYQAQFTPTDRPKPQRTQGGGSRLHLEPAFTLSQSLALQNPVL